MTGDRTAGGRFEYLIKAGAELADLFPYVVHDMLAALCMSDKYPVLVDIIPAEQPVGNIIENHAVDQSAVLFGGLHLAVDNLDTGLEL